MGIKSIIFVRQVISSYVKTYCRVSSKGIFSVSKIQSGVFLVLLTYLQVADAALITIPVGSKILVENSFSGQITDITLDPKYATPGDVTISSKFTADFVLYEDTVTDPGRQYFASEFTFYGINRNYNFGLYGGDGWGSFTINADNSFSYLHANNFQSDGLENTFNGVNGNDFGAFLMNFNDYTSASITGFGSIVWTGVNVDFEITSVPLPTTLWLFGSGLIGLFGITRRKKA